MSPTTDGDDSELGTGIGIGIGMGLESPQDLDDHDHESPILGASVRSSSERSNHDRILYSTRSDNAIENNNNDSTNVNNSSTSRNNRDNSNNNNSNINNNHSGSRGFRQTFGAFFSKVNSASKSKGSGK